MNTRLWRMVRVMVVMLSLVMVSGVVGSASAQTAEDPKDDCKQGGWETLTTAEGDAFENQGGCVSYVEADGGVPVVPVYTPQIDVIYQSGPIGGCQWGVAGSGFAPNTTYSIARYLDGVFWASHDYPADDSGDISVGIFNSSDQIFQVKAYALDDSVNPVAVSEAKTC